jgi:heat-inducible transcriptional repressor
MELTERKKKILRAVVESYIETAEPVGSKSLLDMLDLDVSSATVRNELADLTEQGYLEQPHTSAGRIPSPKGYRLYVNELMEQQRLSMEETRQINEALHLKMQELDKVIDQAGRMVSQLTNYPAFALAEGARRITIKRFDLIMVDANSFIIVVMTDTNVVKNKLVHLPSDLSEPQLQLLTTLLNSSFVGRNLDELTPELMRVAEHAAGNSYGLISLVVSFAMEVLDDLENSAVYTAGTSHILDHPEYQDVGKAQKLMSYLSDDQSLMQALALPTLGDDNTKILIGPENVAEELKDTSVVLASYDIGDGMKGVIGVVGPTRMDYAEVTAKLSYLADNLSRLFAGGEQLGSAPTPPALTPPASEGSNEKT